MEHPRAFLPSKVVLKTIDTSRKKDMNLLGEEPLSIRLDGKPYVVVMRTPGDDLAHAAGFCLSEGIIEKRSHYSSIASCDGEEKNVITVTLTSERRKAVSALLERSAFVSQTSCGICGKELIDDFCEAVFSVKNGVTISFQAAYRLIDELGNHQVLRDATRASHAAAVFDSELNVISVSEDVGRHNAVDKALGRLLMDNRLDEARILVLSSRVSYELVNKAARAKISVILSVSRPTSLAVQLGAKLNIAMASLAKPEGIYIYNGEDRFI